MPILYIMCGPSGSGKSTWARNFIFENEHKGNDIRYVSRDEIRFAILKEREDYFSHEKEVFKKFAGTIRQTLIDGFDIIADATHLNEFSRRKLTQAIDMFYTNYSIVYVVFDVDVNTCLERNAHREGRANVPDTVIQNMCRNFKIPSLNEDERALEIIKINNS